jgi:hypothetical protein
MKTQIIDSPCLRILVLSLISVISLIRPVGASPTSSTTLSGYVDTSALWNVPLPNGNRPAGLDYITRTPYTLSPGSVYVDVGGFYTYKDRTRGDIDRTMETAGGSLELGVGILKNLDAKIWFPGRYNFLTVTDPTGQDTRTRGGVGNLVSSLDYNFFGNDRYPTACTPNGCGGVSSLSLSANMIWPTATCGYSDRFGSGFLQMPTSTGQSTGTSSSDRRDRRDWSDGGDYRGGLSLQYGYRTACGAELRVNSGFTLSDNHGCWESCFDNRLSISKTLFTPKFSIIAGIETQVSTSQRSDWQGQADVGFIYQFTPHLTTYIGSGFGLTDNANDFSPTMHLAYMF